MNVLIQISFGNLTDHSKVSGTAGLPGEGGFPGTVVLKNASIPVRAAEGQPGNFEKTSNLPTICLKDIGVINGVPVCTPGPQGTYLNILNSPVPPDGSRYILYKKFDKSLNQYMNGKIVSENYQGSHLLKYVYSFQFTCTFQMMKPTKIDS